MLTIYGIKNCDTTRKAMQWLAQERLPYHFHDLRVDGLPRDQLAAWVKQHGWEAVINRRSTTWRELAASDKQDLDEARAIDLALHYPTLVKRPILNMAENYCLIGFDADAYAAATHL